MENIMTNASLNTKNGDTTNNEDKIDRLQKQDTSQTEDEIRRIRLPKGNQVIGIIEQRLGAGRSRVRCLDGNIRVCRVPGKLKRFIWLREGDIVLVQPWEFQSNEKGDIIFKYRASQVQWLKQKGLLKLENLREF